MPRASHTNTTPAADVARASRDTIPVGRGLLGGIVALAAGGGAALAAGASQPASNADAELLALCRQFWVHQAVVDARGADEVSTEIGEAAHDQWWGCIRAAEEMPAHTIAGVRAKANIA